MKNQTRRSFLVLAGTSAAAIGAGAGAGAASGSPAKRPKVPSGASGPLVAHVSDVRGDTVSLMVGEREVVVRDSDLVARLAQAAK